ncbi:hypothetical protein Pcinc_022197 [Petrolisthes cinctipes]|uniref:Uncharacterized protein n=1 Tax=Petrolisthes cinctipes TaxID=88211 RepID=A0AAE1FFU1_PETCI|nr:hypothetical protein Pcinc_022197 [Petrolisthes cinctipes]
MLYPTSYTPTHNSTHDLDLTQTPLHHPDIPLEWELLEYRTELIRETLEQHKRAGTPSSSRMYEVLFNALMRLCKEAAECQYRPAPTHVHNPLTQPHHQYTPLPHSHPRTILSTPHITYRHSPTSPQPHPNYSSQAHTYSHQQSVHHISRPHAPPHTTHTPPQSTLQFPHTDLLPSPSPLPFSQSTLTQPLLPSPPLPIVNPSPTPPRPPPRSPSPTNTSLLPHPKHNPLPLHPTPPRSPSNTQSLASPTPR